MCYNVGRPGGKTFVGVLQDACACVQMDVQFLENGDQTQTLIGKFHLNELWIVSEFAF